MSPQPERRLAERRARREWSLSADRAIAIETEQVGYPDRDLSLSAVMAESLLARPAQRDPLANVELEKLVLACITVRPGGWQRDLAHLRPEHFTAPLHRRILAGMRSVTSPDLLALAPLATPAELMGLHEHMCFDAGPALPHLIRGLMALASRRANFERGMRTCLKALEG